MKNETIKIACASFAIENGNSIANTKQICSIIRRAADDGVHLLTFPELSVTGYSCGDMFLNEGLLDATEKSIYKILESSKNSDMVIIVGLPLRKCGMVYNCAAVIQNGKVLAVVPKSSLRNNAGYTESRWFVSGFASRGDEIILCGNSVPFSVYTICTDQYHKVSFGVCFDEDAWSLGSPVAVLAQSGANIIAVLAATHESVTNIERRENLLQATSLLTNTCIAYNSGSPNESTTNAVFSNYQVICFDGKIQNNTDSLDNHDHYCLQNIHIDQIVAIKAREYLKKNNISIPAYHLIPFQLNVNTAMVPLVEKEPFLEGISSDLICERISRLQQKAILKKLRYTGRKKLILGVSGGLDSTVALLACAAAFKEQGFKPSDIIGVTMPGPGTTKRTYQNSIALMQALKITALDIPISDTVYQHLHAIGQPEDCFDITFEQTQSRERTKILMDLANKENAVVVGTGDLSELALGWMTYSGDQISMYGLNSGIPKTIIKRLAAWYTQKATGEIKTILDNITTTPISPELLPVDTSGKQKQKTEDLVGPYIVHDFFLYYFAKCGFSPEKVLYLAVRAFAEDYTEKQLNGWMSKFITRFFTRQFKRTCCPDGLQLFDFSLSPRGGWVMPSDMSYQTMLIE